MIKKTEARFREFAPAARGSQDAGSRNLPSVFHNMSVLMESQLSTFCVVIWVKLSTANRPCNNTLSKNLR